MLGANNRGAFIVAPPRAAYNGRVPPSERTAIPPLTGLRGVAALWVLFYHLYKIGMLEDAHPLLRSLAASGYLGVDVFGILSGFVITYNYGDTLSAATRADVAKYLWARVARIYPLHLFTLALMAGPVALVVSDYNGAHEGGAALLARHLLLVHGWSDSAGLAWNHPSWTVSCEWFCYLAMPVVAPVLMRFRNGVFAAIGAWTSLAGAYFALAALGVRELHAGAGLGLLRISAEFLSGCLLCIAWRRGFAANRSLGAVRYAAIACLLIFSVFPNALVVVLAGWVLVFAIARDPRGWLGANVVVYLGEISYSIYMTHWAVLVVVDDLSRHRRLPSLGAFQFAYALVSVLALSVATYHLIERPSRAFLRRASDARRFVPSSD